MYDEDCYKKSVDTGVALYIFSFIPGGSETGNRNGAGSAWKDKETLCGILRWKTSVSENVFF